MMPGYPQNKVQPGHLIRSGALVVHVARVIQYKHGANSGLVL